MKYCKTLLLIIILILPLDALAQDNVGYSYLGICHSAWPCQSGIKAYSNMSKLNLSFLYDRTFGDDCSCIREMYRDPRDKLIRIHLTNGPGLRNKRLQKEEVFFGHTIASAEEAILKNEATLRQKFEAVANQASSDYRQAIGVNKLYVSTCLECDFSKQARARLIEWAKPFFPSATFVDNPLRDSCLTGIVCERHGDNPSLNPPCIIDLDGKDFNAIDTNAFVENYKSCLAVFLWGYKFNLNDSSRGTFVPPRMRSIIPNEEYFASIKVQK